MSQTLCASDETLRLVRGRYFCPIWNKDEHHWWCVDLAGVIHDPTKDQFPSKGLGIYTEFDGFIECAECGKQVHEDEAKFESNYAFCSTKCIMSFVGL